MPCLDRVRVGELVPCLVERKQSTDSEKHNRHEERVVVTHARKSKRVLFRSVTPCALASHKEQYLVPGIGY